MAVMAITAHTPMTICDSRTRRHGLPLLADEIVSKSHELIENGGFREYYNPYTGEPYGARDFGWSTIVLDM